MSDEKLGYLTRAVEDLVARLDRHMEWEAEERNKEKQARAALNQRLTEIEKSIIVRRGVWKFCGAVGTIIVLILTLRFGDIKAIWTTLH